MTIIHPSAIVQDGAKIAEDVEIGPFCYVGSSVHLEASVKLLSHVCVTGNTRIGTKTKIFPFASLGHEAQDLKYAGEHTELLIGFECIIREGVTINSGTGGDKSQTVVGNNCTFLANSHVAHDCIVGNNVIFSNNVMMGGHAVVENNAIIGGGSGIHQFCRVGSGAFIGAMSMVAGDVIPFGMAVGNRAYLEGLNIIGMKRAGLEREVIHQARHAYRILWSGKKPVIEQAVKIMALFPENKIVNQIAEFIKKKSQRSLCIHR